MIRRTQDLIELLSGKDPLHGAEVGVWKGDNSFSLLKTFTDLHLFLIDSYSKSDITSGKDIGDIGKTSAEDLEVIKQKTISKFTSFKDRVTWILKSSAQAAKEIPDDSLDFVFIDGNHNYDFVKSDIELYLPKVKKEGLIAGHDYGGKFPGIKKAVDELFGNKIELSKRNSFVWWVWK